MYSSIPEELLTKNIYNVIVLHMKEKANTNPSWGKTLTKKELLDMLDRIYAKQKKEK